ncbi:hypothetical protein HX049_18130 [Myroides odoratimimus]|uniref:hypothetical protein n=1 Tax=Myroides odoratimimus TaxID=76832 RepID=UPI002578F17D|nr:hypothetical protein [Myroides odoratimimus]MDM1399048.1 hypothetical protein [Myroides odoratimimus]
MKKDLKIQCQIYDKQLDELFIMKKKIAEKALIIYTITGLILTGFFLWILPFEYMFYTTMSLMVILGLIYHVIVIRKFILMSEVYTMKEIFLALFLFFSAVYLGIIKITQAHYTTDKGLLVLISSPFFSYTLYKVIQIFYYKQVTKINKEIQDIKDKYVMSILDN